MTIGLIGLLSVLLWVFVSFSDEFSVTLNLPTQVVDIPEQMSVSSVSSNNVSIGLKGTGWELAPHTLGRDPSFIIPSPLEAGENEISIRNALAANSWLSSTLQLAEITPEKVIIKIENTKSKMVGIVPLISLSYKAGYGLVSPVNIDPDSVLITGPESLIDQISIVNTEGSVQRDLEGQSSAILKLDQQTYVQTNISECKVDFNVQKIVDKTFDDLVISTKNLPSRYELILSPTKLSVVLRGGIGQLSKLKNENLNVFVRFDQALIDTSGAITPIIEIPDFTSLIDIKPNRLEYIIKKY